MISISLVSCILAYPNVSSLVLDHKAGVAKHFSKADRVDKMNFFNQPKTMFQLRMQSIE